MYTNSMEVGTWLSYYDPPHSASKGAMTWSKAPLLQSDLLTKATGKNLCSKQEKKHVGNTKSQVLTHV